MTATLLLRAALSTNIMMMRSARSDTFQMSFSTANKAIPKDKFGLFCDRLTTRGRSAIPTQSIFQARFAEVFNSLKNVNVFDDNKPKFAMAFVYHKNKKEIEFKCHIFRLMADKPAINIQDVHTTIVSPQEFDDDWFVIDTVDSEGSVLKEETELNGNQNDELIVATMSNLLKSIMVGGDESPRDLVASLMEMRKLGDNNL